MPLSLFSPIYSCASKSSNENWSFLRSATTIFDFGQQSYRIEYVNRNSPLYLHAIDKAKPAWFKIAMRIAAMMTIIIPLVALASIIIYRVSNSFQIQNGLLFSAMPEDIQKFIFKKAIFASPSLASTSKQINTYMKNDHDLVKNLIIAFAIEQSVTVANAMSGNSQAISAICNVAQLVLRLDKKKGLFILNTAINRVKSKSGSYLAEIIKVMAPYDLDNALNTADGIKSNDYKTIAISYITRTIAKDDFQVAAEFLKNFKESNAYESIDTERLVHRARFLALTAICKHSLINLAKYDINEALKRAEADKIFESRHVLLRFKIYKGIAEPIVSFNPKKGLEIANRTVAAANLLGVYDTKIKAIKMIIRSVFFKYYPKQAIEVANSIGDHVFVAKALAQSKLVEALNEANAIEDVSSKCIALCKIAKEISSKDPEKAYEIIEQAVVYAKSVSNMDVFETGLIYCSGTLARFNLEKALEIAIALKDKTSRAAAFTKILKEIAFTNAKETAKVACLIFKEAKSIVYEEKEIGRDGDNTHNVQSAERLNAFLNVAKTLVPH
ncbi:MAG: hypothetical protein H0W50_09225 [Parachlamydiaceae bacterium]|nr:hypothetical protein [Parachlamydiaceae bacterium]